MRISILSVAGALGNFSGVNATELHLWEINFGPGNGLMLLDRQQDISRVNFDPDQCCHLAPLGHYEFIGDISFSDY